MLLLSLYLSLDEAVYKFFRPLQAMKEIPQNAGLDVEILSVKLRFLNFSIYLFLSPLDPFMNCYFEQIIAIFLAFDKLFELRLI
jgi:hypothetical protein